MPFQGDRHPSTESLPYKWEQEVREEFPAGKLMLHEDHDRPVDHPVMWGERAGRKLLTKEWKEGIFRGQSAPNMNFIHS